jgi:hypothetical protein
LPHSSPVVLGYSFRAAAQLLLNCAPLRRVVQHPRQPESRERFVRIHFCAHESTIITFLPVRFDHASMIALRHGSYSFQICTRVFFGNVEIDRQGNRRMRTLLVEAVWRLKKWNPTWRGFKKFPHVFGAHVMTRGATRKRAVVACARLLANDLWRLQTGRVTLKNLGLKPAQSQ